MLYDVCNDYCRTKCLTFYFGITCCSCKTYINVWLSNETDQILEENKWVSYSITGRVCEGGTTKYDTFLVQQNDITD